MMLAETADKMKLMKHQRELNRIDGRHENKESDKVTKKRKKENAEI